MMDVFEINEYRYRVKGYHFTVYFYAREDQTANEMKELYEQGMDVKLILKKKKHSYITTPHYVKEQDQLKVLKEGLEK